MSASKYRWTPACDGQPCVGDCDLCRVDNLQSGIYTDNPDDTLRYVQTTVPVFDHWGYEKKQDDYVQVVRCKDCVHYHKSDKGHPDCEWCKRLICGTIKPDFFCADGERRSECSTP